MTGPAAGAAVLSRALRARIDALLGRGGRRILGVAGAPGAGKSTLADAIGRAYAADCAVVPMDGFHLAQVELERLGRAGRKGAADTFDAAGFVALLRRLRSPVAGEMVYAPAFRREIEEPVAGSIALDPAMPLVVVEGNYLLLDGPWAPVRELLDESWFIDTDETLRADRLLARHVAFGRTRDAALAWIASTDAPNAVTIAATRVRADLVVRL